MVSPPLVRRLRTSSDNLLSRDLPGEIKAPA